MDNVQAKISEARHFLDRMRCNQGNQSEFNYNLSAFLTASRSALQYIHNYIVGISSAQQWYDQRIADSMILRTFKELRNENIHGAPVATTKHATSAGDRNHYFQSDYTQHEVLDHATKCIYELQDFLSDGIANGFIPEST